ncbi:type IV toxin-antitoxin system AbiEi family antitoxin domain-containing protein [Collinsella sp. AGMB00827]|uniref:Type IV toxin-antitoxin system AbiEi family antitoxin domain-containing protein n=1 Tax=Collinsella ureilytica TaxID=2869515 RepID=A0ABS7MJ91_9ACTN|nr:type IV toxin-antitoxin system AbiEi family antitoxin domain-containing protein [Collinsella urealyticum]MBY4797444.1 type IV toxin-antitoxin system AbiEi family antitoxin domain-containing protein [Collinsella urealyticum]
MSYSNHIAALNELSSSEGVFTTAQAGRLGITRNALSQAVASGRAERIAHGAYKLSGSQSDCTDELAAIWKLTNPPRFSHERMQMAAWDGIAIGGSTAASLLEIGDFYLSPYRIYAPKRINSRISSASFAVRRIDRLDIVWIKGLPVTCPERTLIDLCIDSEEWSLVRDAMHDVERINNRRLIQIVASLPDRKDMRNRLTPIREYLSDHCAKECR